MDTQKISDSGFLKLEFEAEINGGPQIIAFIWLTSMRGNFRLCFDVPLVLH
jgi:hypothetical protein